MRSLALFSLVLLSALPLAAHGRHPILAVAPAGHRDWDRDRYERDRHDYGRFEGRREGWYRDDFRPRHRRDWDRCEDESFVVLRPRIRLLAPPWEARFDVHLR